MVRLSREQGSTTVELAFVLTLLLLITFGITDFGLLLYRQEILTNASREGARYGILLATPAHTTAQIQTVVNNYLTSIGWNAANATVNVTGAGGAFGSSLTVQVSYPFTYVLNGFVPGLTSRTTLTGQTVMLHE